ncbi:GRXC11 [Linum perenne]
MDKVRDLASKKAAVIFTKSTCCMCHSIKQLFYELGASPAIHEVDREVNGRELEWAGCREMEKALMKLGTTTGPVPAVFIGGKFMGSTNEIMSAHLSGQLVHMLKPYQSLS